MLLKLFSWRRSAYQTLTLSSNVSFHLTHPPILSLSRFLSQSQFEDPYDPPFSPTSKTLKPNNETTKKNKNQKKKKKKSHEEASSDSKNSQTFPLKSDLPFDFKYSYSETNSSVDPIGFREPPRFSPFGPGQLDRKWTGTCAPAEGDYDSEKVAGERNAVLGEPLSEEEVAELVERYRHNDCSRQINLDVTTMFIEDEKSPRVDLVVYALDLEVLEGIIGPYWSLWAALGPVFETIILLDRLLFLQEQDNPLDAVMLPIFDPILSPIYASIQFIPSLKGSPNLYPPCPPCE